MKIACLTARRRVTAALSLLALAGAATMTITPLAATAATTGGAAAVLTRMTLAQRVGQLFMVGSAAASPTPATMSEIRAYHVGNVMLTGRSSLGTAHTKSVTVAFQRQATAASTSNVPLFMATDQEGGAVQVLTGPGFLKMPTGLTQGTWSLAGLRHAASTWGWELRAAGVNLDLAPVVDTVPSAAARNNPPIGGYRREYGYTTTRVAGHGAAFVGGLAEAHVAAAAKHFPGLGRVTANPDTAARVTDQVTSRHDAYLTPFKAAIAAGSQFIMVSTAYYSRLDNARPAAFSPFVIKTMLRGDLGFNRVVISDDLGNARQVAVWTPAQRAVKFVAAGGDMVLTVNPSLLPAMYNAVLARAKTDPAFRAVVDAAALRILTSKQNQGLLPPA